MENIFAYTVPTTSLPAYVSLNEREGVVELSVRTSGQPNASVINLSDEELERLSNNIRDYLTQKG